MTDLKKIGLCLLMILVSHTTVSASVWDNAVLSDTIKPIIVQEAADQVVECNGLVLNQLSLWYNSSGGAMATDNSGNVTLVPDLSFQEAQDSLDFNTGNPCGLNSSVTITWTAVDDCNNESETSTTAVFSTEDTEDPGFVAPATQVVLLCDEFTQDSLNNWVENKAGLEGIDDCSTDVTFTQYIWNGPGGTSGSGDFTSPVNIPLNTMVCGLSYTVSFFIQDDCGNTSVTTGSFMINDEEPPVWSIPIVDVTVSCDDTAVPTTIFGVDACIGELTPEVVSISTQGSDPQNCNYYNYTIQRTWTAFDACSNIIEDSHQVTVLDLSPPTFDIIDTINVNCSELDSTIVNFVPTNISDNCSTVTLSSNDVQVGQGCDFRLERTWTATDICGNATDMLQVINIMDTEGPEILVPAQDSFLSCDNVLNLTAELTAWIGSRGYSQVTEDCSFLTSFAATPGTYDINDPLNNQGTLSLVLEDQGCPSASGTLNMLTVDFVFFDSCGNVVVSTASFGITDNEAPVIVDCPADISVDSEGPECQAVYTLETLNVTDNCSATQSPVEFSLTESISSSNVGDPNTPVDSVLFNFGPINLFNNPANGNVSIDLSVINIDSGEPLEFFNIKGEDGSIIGMTAPIIGIECTDSMYVINNLTSAQINAWGADGFIDIWLVPNMPNSGVFTINDVCGGSSAEMSLSFDIDLQDTADPAYSINNGDTIFVSLTEFPIDVTLETGVNEIEYFYFDCAANAASCTHTVTVVDAMPPIIECPDDLTIDLEQDSCSVTYPLSFDFQIEDNCGFPSIYDERFPETFEAALLPFSFNADLDTFVADNVFFSFEEVSPIFQTSTQPLLTVEIRGDIDEDLEAYEIFGENGVFLGTTALNTSNPCDSSSIVLPIELSLFNEWAIDGQIIITALAPDDPSISGGGINNCVPILPGEDTDGVSVMYASLSYADAEVFYSVDGATTINSTLLIPGGVDTLAVLNGGINTITYQTSDAFGNEGTCSFEVLVRDQQEPKISCQDQVVFVHPSGLEDLILDHEELLSDFMDNCGIINFDISPAFVDCSMEGEVIDVTIIATDEQGNSGFCVSQVRVETPVLEPTFTAGICEGDTLQLFANVPPSSVPNGYTYSWSGPDNFTSVLENPIIPNPTADNNGTYVLDVVGFNGCNSKGTVEVFIQQLTTPEIFTDLDIECLGNDLILNATSYTGDVFYLWYEGIPSSGILLQTTTNPSIILNPTLGAHNYYVEVSSPLCSTLPSLPTTIEIVEPPVASVISPFLTICEGDDIVLGTDEFDPSFEYFWTGPDNYSGTGQFPEVISDVTSINEGLYNLMISNGACFSDTVITQVVIFNTPETPIITGDDVYCEGTSIVLSVNNVTDADLYSWYLNGNLFIAQASNTLFIPSANTNFSGNWTVSLTDGLCVSENSEEVSVFVESEFQIGISSNSPVCEGDSISLSASFIPNAQYTWEAPDGSQFQGQSVMLDALEGSYTVVVNTESGCQNEESTLVQINDIPSITALSNNAANCMDGTEDISFFPSVVPPGQYTYDWSGPQSFGSGEINPIINNASSIHNGVYTLIVANGDCISEPEVTVVDITDIPDQPIIEAEDIYCQGESFSILTDTISGAEYLWSTPVGDVVTDEPSLDISVAENLNQGMYSLVIDVDGCLSIPSTVSNVNIQEIPNIPNALSNSPVCTGDTLFFNAIQLTDAVYQWVGPNGYSSFEKDPFIADVSGFDSGEYRVRVVVNGCPSEFNSVFVDVISSPEQPALTEVEYSLCDDGGSSVEICLSGNFADGTNHEFFVNNQSIVITTDTCAVIDVGELNLQADNEIFVISEFMGCLSETSIASNLNLDAIPMIEAQAQDDNILLCDESEVTLVSVEGAPLVNVSWSAINNDDIVFEDIDDRSTVATNLPNGNSQVLLEYSSGSCNNYSRDTITIFNLPPPIAVNDTLFLEVDRGMSINMLDNDLFTQTIELEVLQEPMEGSFEIINGFVTYTPDPRFPGIHELTYEICYVDCPDLCSIGTLILDVEFPTECIIPNIITPNGDNVNDAFVISCFAANNFPDNEVIIFNEWGDEVFSARPYLNDWAGTYNNAELPTGTYYYIVDRGDGSRPENGFVHIEK